MLESSYLVIILASAAAGLAAGFVMHRSDFCVTAMFRDLFLFRDPFLLRMLALLVVVSMLLFEAGRAAGALRPYPFPLLGPPALTTLVGGFLFGVGMVLAGGCVVGTLYKLGGGSMVSLVAFVGLLAGSALYAEWHPAWSALAAATRLSDAIALPQSLALPPPALTLPLAAAGGVLLYRWWRQGLMTRRSHARGHLPAWQAALALAGIGFGSYLFVGMPLGITTAYAKLGATVESWLWPAHVQGLAYFRQQGLVYQPPFATEVIRGGAGPGWDAIAAIQYPLIIGVVLGAAFSALRVGEWRLHYRIPGRQYLSALVGGVIVGAASRMAPACNVWHLWGGLPILALQSLLFLAGLLPGAWVGSRLLTRFVVR
jgi:uncharacterized membrane protein YedE/YeeE